MTGSAETSCANLSCTDEFANLVDWAISLMGSTRAINIRSVDLRNRTPGFKQRWSLNDFQILKFDQTSISFYWDRLIACKFVLKPFDRALSDCRASSYQNNLNDLIDFRAALIDSQRSNSLSRRFSRSLSRNRLERIWIGFKLIQIWTFLNQELNSSNSLSIWKTFHQAIETICRWKKVNAW